MLIEEFAFYTSVCYACVYMCICVHAHVCFIYLNKCHFIEIYTHICTHICLLCEHMYVYTYMCVYNYFYEDVCVHI